MVVVRKAAHHLLSPLPSPHTAVPFTTTGLSIPQTTPRLPTNFPSMHPLLPSRRPPADGDGSPKKLHHHRPPFPVASSSRRRPSAALALSLLCTAAALAIAASALLRPTRTVTVFRCGRDLDSLRTFRSISGGGGELAARKKLVGLVGVLTGLGSESADRREALRSTWFPPDPDALANLEHTIELSFRFVIGRTRDEKKMAELRKEEKYHDFLYIDVNEDTVKPPYKTLAFLKAAFSLFEVDFYVKTEDTIFLRPDRLATFLAKERTHPLTYIGCMKKGPVITDPKSKWYEGQSDLIGSEYFTHAHGAIYALSTEIVSTIVTARNNSLRMFSNEDVTIGSWMLSMNVHHEDNKAMCEPQCSPTSIAVWDMARCSGLCNPVKQLKQLHNTTMCSKSPTLPEEEEAR